MSNNFFSFKQFTVHQDQCAMKVCTDACLFGAWTASKIPGLKPMNNILDIGCGTGVLSLMLAQKTTGHIHAIEIDAAASRQAMKNVAISPWTENILVSNISLQQFVPNKKYDLIICNPPFFEEDLRSPDSKKNAAKHDTTLRLQELSTFIKHNLEAGGIAAVLVPYQRTSFFSTTVKNAGLFITETTFVKQSVSHTYFRSMLLLSHENKPPVKANELIIHDEARMYTEKFSLLLKDYYLNL